MEATRSEKTRPQYLVALWWAVEERERFACLMMWRNKCEAFQDKHRFCCFCRSCEKLQQKLWLRDAQLFSPCNGVFSSRNASQIFPKEFFFFFFFERERDLFTVPIACLVHEKTTVFRKLFIGHTVCAKWPVSQEMKCTCWRQAGKLTVFVQRWRHVHHCNDMKRGRGD